MEAKDAGPTAKRSDISVVAEDKNWRSYIANELQCAERWHHDWGFLAAGAIEGRLFVNKAKFFFQLKLKFFIP